jgi:hypothetical protein
MDFKEQVVINIIPKLQMLYDEEYKHLNYLKDTKIKLLEKSKKFFAIVFESDIIMIDNLIKQSENRLLRYKQSILQYDIYSLSYIKKEQLN